MNNEILPFFLQNVEEPGTGVIGDYFRNALLEGMALGQSHSVSVFFYGIADFLQPTAVVGEAVVIDNWSIGDEDVEAAID